MKKKVFCFFVFFLFFGFSNLNAKHHYYQRSIFTINNQQNFAEIYNNKSANKNLYSILGNSKVFGYKNENFYGLKKNRNKKSYIYSHDYGYSYGNKDYKRENGYSYSGKPIRLAPIGAEFQSMFSLYDSDCDDHGNGNGNGHDEHGNGNGYGHDCDPTNPVPVGDGLYALLFFLTFYIFFIRSNIFKNKI